MALRFSLGNDLFPKLIEESCYYVDKTNIIKELLKDFFEVYLITRPRRFGKTLTMSMLEHFFDMRISSRENFDGLEISCDTEFCDKWMNKWPVIFLSLKSIEGTDYDNAVSGFAILISDLCKKHAYLEESECLDRDDIECFKRLKARQSSYPELCDSLYLLIRIMSVHYGKSVIVLIDEYDVPLAKASEAGYYDKMLDMLRILFGKALKTNEYLKFAVITGCLKIAKESIFTGLNNLVCDTISEGKLCEYIGFTESDVRKLLFDAGFDNHIEEIKEWYDGYRFGLADIYCPWDVINHVSALQVNPDVRPKNYWENTSHNGIIKTFIKREGMNVQDKFETLMAGGYIIEKIIDNLTYDVLRTDYKGMGKGETTEQNFWNLLYMTGYLTTKDDEDLDDKSGDDNYEALCIPNEEVKSIFQTAIIGWFRESVQENDRKELFDAMWNGDADKIADMISDILFETISYYDYKESYYHAFIAGLFSGAGYSVESNYEYGNGRPDIVVKDRKNRRALLFEVKHSNSKTHLPDECNRAVRQIGDKRYEAGLEAGFKTVICYGIAFYKKECMVKRF